MACFVTGCSTDSLSMGWQTSAALFKNSSGLCHTPYLKVVLGFLFGVPWSSSCSVVPAPFEGGAASNLYASSDTGVSEWTYVLYSGIKGW